MALMSKYSSVDKKPNITVDNLTTAIYRLKPGLSKENARKDAFHVMNFFGFGEEILDNVLEPEDRDMFYMLEDEDVLDTTREETTLYDGREWRIHHWVINKEKIFEILDSVVSVVEYDNANIKQKVDVLDGLAFLSAIQQMPFTKDILNCGYYGGSPEAADFFLHHGIVVIDDDGYFKLRPAYFSFLKKTIGDFCDKDADINSIHQTLTKLNFSITFNELETIIKRGIFPREGGFEWRIHEREARKTNMLFNEIKKLDHLLSEQDVAFYKNVIEDKDVIETVSKCSNKIKQKWDILQTYYSAIQTIAIPEMSILQNSNNTSELTRYKEELMRICNLKQKLYDKCYQFNDGLSELLDQVNKVSEEESNKLFSKLGSYGPRICSGESWIGENFDKIEERKLIGRVIEFKDLVLKAEGHNLSSLEEEVFQLGEHVSYTSNSKYNLFRTRMDLNTLIKLAIAEYALALNNLSSFKDKYYYGGGSDGRL